MESEETVPKRRRVLNNNKLVVDDPKRIDKDVWREWQEQHGVTTRPPVSVLGFVTSAACTTLLGVC